MNVCCAPLEQMKESSQPPLRETCFPGKFSPVLERGLVGSNDTKATAEVSGGRVSVKASESSEKKLS